MNNNYFDSDEFLKVLSRLENVFPGASHNASIGNLMEISFAYFKCFNKLEDPYNTEGLTEFLNSYVNDLEMQATSERENGKNFYISSLGVRDIQDKAILKEFIEKDPALFGDKSEIRDVLNMSAFRNDKLHSTNSYAAQQIQNVGALDPDNLNSDEFVKDMNKLLELEEKIPYSGLCGVKSADKDKGVYYALTAVNSYIYAKSPEWLKLAAQCAGEWMDDGRDGNLGFTAFSRRDKQEFVNCMTKYMEFRGYGQQDINEALSIYEKYWDRCNVGNPVLIAVVDESADNYLAATMRDDIRAVLDEYIFCRGYVDCSTNKKIDTTNAVYFDMPNPATLDARLDRISASLNKQNATTKLKEEPAV